jgi:hypothetical protein
LKFALFSMWQSGLFMKTRSWSQISAAPLCGLCLVAATLSAQQPQTPQTETQQQQPADTAFAQQQQAQVQPPEPQQQPQTQQEQPPDTAIAQQQQAQAQPPQPPQQPQTQLQTPPQQQTQPQIQLRPQPAKTTNNGYGLTGRYYFGFRVEFFPLSLFKTSFTQTTVTTPPVASYSYFPSNGSQKAALAATFEYMFTPRLSAGAEFYLTHAKYTLTTQVRSGLPGPNSGVDDRPLTTYAESSNADYWVFPMLARYGGIRPRGFLSHLYVAAGAEYRHVGRVRTGTDIYYPDGTTGYTEIAAVPTNSNQIGGVIGLGLRMLDDLGIKVAPEIRFIRWTNSTFEGPGYHSQMNQAEAGLGFSF